MTVHRTIGFALGLLLLAAPAALFLHRNAPSSAAHAAPHGTAGRRSAVLNAAYGKIPISFEENAGQTDARVSFLSRRAGYTLFITPTESVAVLTRRSAARVEPGIALNPIPRQNIRQSEPVLRTRLIGANEHAEAHGEEPLEGKSNYLIGNDPSKWRTNVAQYAKVRLSEVYPGIDLLYYGNQRQLECDYVVAPGADPRQIRLQFDVADQIAIDPSGDLLIHAGDATVRQQLPIVYQERNGKREVVRASYRRSADRQFGIELASYDRSRPIVIDPAIIYNSYVGGSGDDEGFDIAVDSSGDCYFSGFSTSTDFPLVGSTRTNAGIGDVFVVKLNRSGSALLYSTVFGGSATEFANGLAVDSSGSVIVAGQTLSSDFPTTPGALLGTNPLANVRGFVTKLTPDGSDFVYSTYLGGSTVDIAEGIATDSSGNAYITGFTGSPDFPTTVGAPQRSLPGGVSAFVTKLTPTGDLSYSTFLGGNTGDEGNGIAVDSSGNAYVTGYATSPNFPTTAGAPQRSLAGTKNGFLTKVNAAGTAFSYSTYFGGTGTDIGQRVAVDSEGNTFVVGSSTLPSAPSADELGEQTAAQPNAAPVADSVATIVAVNAAGTRFNYQKHIGDGGNTFGRGIALASGDSVFVTGYTTAADLVTTTDAIQRASGGKDDGFVIELDGNGSTIYSSYDGGANTDHDFGAAVDGDGNLYIVGTSNAFNGVTVDGTRQLGSGGGFDIRVLKLSFNADARRHAIVSTAP